jgi:hypothetical protein
MSLVCAVPSFTDLTAATGQDVIVVGSGNAATRLRLDEVLPVHRGGKLFFRALLSGEEGSEIRNGTYLSRVGDHLVRLHLVRREATDGAPQYEAHAQAHVDQIEQFARFERHHLAAV